MFPDYLMLLRAADGRTIPVAVEVKGSDNGRPVDGSSDGSIDAKALRLAELSSSDDNAYGRRSDTISSDGSVIRYGRGNAIGALVFKDKGVWRVYGQGASEEFGVWIKSRGVGPA